MGTYTGRQSHLADPAEHAFTITPSDTNDLPNWALALYIGTAGNLRLDTWAGETVTFTNVPAGLLPVRTRRVRATGTTAADIIGLY